MAVLKEKTQAQHARRRYYERAYREGDDADRTIHALTQLAVRAWKNWEQGRALAVYRLMKQSCRVCLYQIDFEGRFYYVAFDGFRRQIATFLTADMALHNSEVWFRDADLDDL